MPSTRFCSGDSSSRAESEGLRRRADKQTRAGPPRAQVHRPRLRERRHLLLRVPAAASSRAEFLQLIFDSLSDSYFWSHCTNCGADPWSATLPAKSDVIPRADEGV